MTEEEILKCSGDPLSRLTDVVTIAVILKCSGDPLSRLTDVVTTACWQRPGTTSSTVSYRSIC